MKAEADETMKAEAAKIMIGEVLEDSADEEALGFLEDDNYGPR